MFASPDNMKVKTITNKYWKLKSRTTIFWVFWAALNWYKIFCKSLHYFLVFTTNLFLLHKTTYRHKLVDTSLCELQSLFYILKCLAAPDYHTVDAGGATSGYNGKQILDRFLMIMANMSPSLSYSSSISYKESNIWIRSSIQRTSCTTFNALPSLHHQKTHKISLLPPWDPLDITSPAQWIKLKRQLADVSRPFSRVQLKP